MMLNVKVMPPQCHGAVLLSLVLGLTSCGTAMEELPTGTAIGKVKWSGTPLTRPVVLVGVERKTGRVCQGRIEADGRCQLLFGASSEIPAGTYDVALAPWDEPMTEEQYAKIMRREIPPPPPLNVPAKFLDSKKSGLNVEVAEGERSFEFTIPTQ